ncbi:MAG: Bug family tripartite tricarboxylate transporter substrate binding protein [Xanthobacteraceae bacterium]
MFGRILSIVLALTLTTPAWAQAWPNRPIRMIAPFPAGGLVDVLARAIGEELTKTLGQPIIIENKPGAGGNLGADIAAKAAPDGYTLLMTSPGIQSINQFLYKSMPFEPEKAFTPISNVADMSMLVVVHPKTKLKTLKELIAFARANPGKLNFGSAGIGTTGHLGQALLTHVAKINLTHIPYRGAAPSVKDLIAGQIDGVVDNPPTVVAHIRAGTIVPLAVAAKQRLSVLPQVPTAPEAGLPGWEASSWFGVVAPAGTPPAIVKRLHAAIAKAVKQPSMQRFSGQSGARMIGDSPTEFGAFIVAERKKWGEIVKAAGIQAQ